MMRHLQCAHVGASFEMAHSNASKVYVFPAIVSSNDLAEVYDSLGSTIGYEEEPKDVSYRFVAAGLVLLALAAGASLRWFSRLP